MQDPFLFGSTILLILATPGPTNMLLAAGGATLRTRRALPLVAAEAVGYTITILLVGLLLGPIVASVPALSLGLRLTIGAYLIWLAAKLQRHQVVDPDVAPVTPWQVFLTTLLNPKGLLFALGVMPFSAPDWPLYFLAFLLMLLGVSLCWIALGAGLGRAAAAAGQSSLVSRLFAATIGIFAIVLLIGPLLG